MTYVTSPQVADLAVDLLTHELTLVNTVSQVSSTNLSGPSGGRTIIAVPTSRTANVQTRNETTGVVSDLVQAPIVETEVDFTVAHIYDYAPVTTHDMTLDIVNYGRQVTLPQVKAVAAGAEGALSTVMNAVPISREVNPTDFTDIDNAIALAVADLDDAMVPYDQRYLAVSPTFAARLTSPDSKVLTDYQGEVATEALRRGIVGEYRGLIVVKNPRISGFKAVAYHRSAFAFGSMRPADLPGVFGQSGIAEGPIQLRHVHLTDATKGSALSLVSVFAGAALVDADRVVAIGEGDES